MPIRATLRVIPEPGTGAAPERTRLDAAATRLKKLGFKVIRVGRFGVSVEAPERQFRTVLGYTAANPLGGAEEVHTPDRTLAKLVDLVEVAPTPQYF